MAARRRAHCARRLRSSPYDGAVSIAGELERARELAFASQEGAARDLLLSLMPHIVSDDHMLEVFAQLGEIYLVRTANDGVAECITRIRECLDAYRAQPGQGPQIGRMVARYSRRADFLDIGLAAARGDHDRAAERLCTLADPADDEQRYLLCYAKILCATALSDDDLHHRALPLWEEVLAALEDTGSYHDRLLVLAGIGYGGFCIQTGRLAQAEPWLRRAGARAQASGWELDTARTQLERAVASWSVGDHVSTDALIGQAYPVIARYARAHDVSRCWLYMGYTRLAAGALEQADECWQHAERHWRELGKPLHLHRILLQRSWIPIFFGRFGEAVELIAQARILLDEWPRSSWLQYARLDDQLGTVWRADALADLGFDGSGDPDDDWADVEAKHQASIGATYAESGTPGFRRAMAKLEQAAELKVPAALAVDSVRYSITDAEARARWAARVSGPMLAGAFAVAWEWENTALTAELIEYHSARGTFSTEPTGDPGVPIWSGPPAVAVDSEPELADVAAGPVMAGPSLTRLGPLPPLRMDPGRDTILGRYRALARQRYGREVTTGEAAWPTWP
jgi:tetratricopeptide (TPR) repeat protein